MQIIMREEALRTGSKTYYEGSPCLQGHEAVRRTDNRNCTKCVRLWKLEYRRKNPGESARYRSKNREALLAREAVNRELKREPERERFRKFRAENRKRLNLKAAERRKNNPKQFHEREKRRRLADPEQFRQQRRRYHAKNREKILKRKSVYWKKNREKWRLYRANRRARACGDVRDKLTEDDIAAMLASQKHRCVYCKANLKLKKWHIDHIEPISRGGTNSKNNLQILCAPCNLSKHAKDPVEFAQSMGMLL
jgi:5-methylcytosine-specific restriction endonuclease McrA